LLRLFYFICNHFYHNAKNKTVSFSCVCTALLNVLRQTQDEVLACELKKFPENIVVTRALMGSEN
jgi:hypothetical protein